jgi:LmbE family N-acetylglucosaminyl deacetylase
MSVPGARVVVSPHLDDAVLSAWLVLHGQPGTRVVTCFAGDPPDSRVGVWDTRTGVPGGPDAIRARRAEDRRALAHSGSVPVHLGLPDAQYRDGNDEETAARLVEELEPRLVDAEQVWLPAGLGGHVDHVLARQAGLAASDGAVQRFLYADLPYAGQPAWPVPLTRSPRDVAVHVAVVMAGRRPQSEVWRLALAELPGVEWGDPLVHALTPQQKRRKLDALDEYRTQLPALRCTRRNLLRRRRLFRYEACWTI